ncbi:hypothetical protein ACFWA5_50875, partial [Streptomyces mirabilis]
MPAGTAGPASVAGPAPADPKTADPGTAVPVPAGPGTVDPAPGPGISFVSPALMSSSENPPL